MADDRRAGIVAGAILVALGLALLAGRFVPGFAGELVVLGLGGAFLALYFYTRQYGLLVPGGVLTGLGLGIVAQRTFGPQSVTIGLGIGFVLVWVFDRLYTRASNWWPLVPGGILTAAGLAAAVPSLGRYADVLWPLVLLVVGAVLIVMALRGRHA